MNEPAISIDTFKGTLMFTVSALVDILTFCFVDQIVSFLTRALKRAWCVQTISITKVSVTFVNIVTCVRTEIEETVRNLF